MGNLPGVMMVGTYISHRVWSYFGLQCSLPNPWNAFPPTRFLHCECDQPFHGRMQRQHLPIRMCPCDESDDCHRWFVAFFSTFLPFFTDNITKRSAGCSVLPSDLSPTCWTSVSVYRFVLVGIRAMPHFTKSEQKFIILYTNVTTTCSYWNYNDLIAQEPRTRLMPLGAILTTLARMLT